MQQLLMNAGNPSRRRICQFVWRRRQLPPPRV